MRVAISIDSENDAVDEHEVARILRNVADHIDAGLGDTLLRDINGNTIGRLEVGA